MKTSSRFVFALCLSLGAPLWAGHSIPKKGFGQLQADTKNFKHAQSTRASLGKPLPNFAVQTLDGKGLTKRSLAGKMTVFVLADTKCPCVLAVQDRVGALGRKYAAKGLKVVYVFSMPDERAVDVARYMHGHKIPFPAILDRNQRLLKMLDGRASSEVYLSDKRGVLRYRGRVDDATFDPKGVKSRDLERAIVSLSKNQKVARPFVPAMGCAIPRI